MFTMKCICFLREFVESYIVSGNAKLLYSCTKAVRGQREVSLNFKIFFFHFRKLNCGRVMNGLTEIFLNFSIQLDFPGIQSSKEEI